MCVCSKLQDEGCTQGELVLVTLSAGKQCVIVGVESRLETERSAILSRMRYLRGRMSFGCRRSYYMPTVLGPSAKKRGFCVGLFTHAFVLWCNNGENWNYIPKPQVPFDELWDPYHQILCPCYMHSDRKKKNVKLGSYLHSILFSTYNGTEWTSLTVPACSPSEIIVVIQFYYKAGKGVHGKSPTGSTLHFTVVIYYFECLAFRLC